MREKKTDTPTNDCGNPWGEPSFTRTATQQPRQRQRGERKPRKRKQSVCVYMKDKEQTLLTHNSFHCSANLQFTPDFSPPLSFSTSSVPPCFVAQSLPSSAVSHIRIQRLPPTCTPPKAAERGGGQHYTGGTGFARDRSDDAVPVAGTTRPLSPLSPPQSTGDAPLRCTECCRKTCPLSQR